MVQVRVLPSQAKNRLYVGNIPRALTHEQLVDILKPITKGPSDQHCHDRITIHASHYSCSGRAWLRGVLCWLQ